MTVPGDRPAAELLGVLPLSYADQAAIIEDLSLRLARAEQALADVEELADDFDAHGRWASAADIRDALRASQGDSDA